jgi:hypothetical protein
VLGVGAVGYLTRSDARLPNIKGFRGPSFAFLAAPRNTESKGVEVDWQTAKQSILAKIADAKATVAAARQKVGDDDPAAGAIDDTIDGPEYGDDKVDGPAAGAVIEIDGPIRRGHYKNLRIDEPPKVVVDGSAGTRATPDLVSSVGRKSADAEGVNGVNAEVPPYPWLTDADLADVNALFNSWGAKPGEVNHNKGDREFTDKQIVGELNALADATDPQIIKRAFAAALNTTRATAAEGSKSRGGKAMLSFFRTKLGAEVDRLRLAAAKLEAEARAENAVQERRLEKRLRDVEQGGQGRRRRGASLDDVGDEVWGSE